MWRAAAGQQVKVDVGEGGDDWETDPDFEVPVSTSSSFPPVIFTVVTVLLNVLF